MVLRYSWLCSQGSLLARLQGPSMVLEVKYETMMQGKHCTCCSSTNPSLNQFFFYFWATPSSEFRNDYWQVQGTILDGGYIFGWWGLNPGRLCARQTIYPLLWLPNQFFYLLTGLDFKRLDKGKQKFSGLLTRNDGAGNYQIMENRKF